jgi:uncharacterized protein YndB with AHSA1/START domain
MIDIVNQLNAIQRQVSRRPVDDTEEVSVLLTRHYDAAIDDVWHAITDPDRIKRWLMPISGDLRVGGKFQLEGNAGGEILQCEPPRLLKVTFGGETSIVEVRLSADSDERTTFELEHTVPIELAGGGAGALYVGPGWDGALMGLGRFLSGKAVDDPVKEANSPEVQEFSKGSVHAWAAEVERSKTATADELASAVEVSLAQFAPDLN